MNHNDAIADIVKPIIEDVLHVTGINDSDTIFDDLGGDSLETTEIVMAVEEAYDYKFSFSDEELSVMNRRAELTVSDIIEAISVKLSEIPAIPAPPKPRPQG